MKQTIATDRAPGAIGPYSQAVSVPCSKLLFCSGQVALHPESGEVIGKSAAEQCEQVMKNLGEVLKAGGADFTKVVKTTIYLKDMDDFAEVNKVYGSVFQGDPPARATVEVSRLPKDVKVEIDAIAAL